jgi:hypothetical protein
LRRVDRFVGKEQLKLNIVAVNDSSEAFVHKRRSFQGV